MDDVIEIKELKIFSRFLETSGLIIAIKKIIADINQTIVFVHLQKIIRIQHKHGVRVMPLCFTVMQGPSRISNTKLGLL